MDNDIREMLSAENVDIVRFVDISTLPANQTHGFLSAILICMALSKSFLSAVRNGEYIEHDEFLEKEHTTDKLADWLAEYVRGKGYRAYSQSESSIYKDGNYDEKTKTSRLPHKTIARLAGLGYIGKNNLLMTEEYGCGFSICTVLTDAPITTEKFPLVSSKCGDCEICKSICPTQAIYGVEWSENCSRDAIVDVFRCTCKLKCVVNCPHTLNYALYSQSPSSF